MKSKRALRGAKRIDAQAMRSLVGSQQMTTSLGVVRQFPGESSHFSIDTSAGTHDVLVEVELIPSQTRVTCRLGFGGDGIYRIPRANSEVAVLVPFDPASMIKDSLDFGAIIVAVLDSNAPSQLSDVDTVVIDAAKVRVISNDIQLGDSPAPLDFAVVGSGIDPFSRSTYFALQNTSQKVKVLK